MKIIEFKGVGFGYLEQALILSEVNFTISQGEKVLILGSNGSGKSTLSLLAAGLLKPKKGEIRAYSEHSQILRRGIVFQNSRVQVIGSTIEEDLAFGLTVLNIPSNQIQQRVNEYLELFGLAHKRDRGVHQLSGGELKRLALASVLITEPELLILDEPLAMLDYANQQLFLDVLNSMVPAATAILWLDHDIKSIRYVPVRYLLTDYGKVRQVTIEELNSASFLEKYQLQPTPLQPLEWKYPEKIKKAVFGPEMVEFKHAEN